MTPTDELHEWLNRSRLQCRDVVRLFAPGDAEPILHAKMTESPDEAGKFTPTAADLTETARAHAVHYAGEAIYTVKVADEAGRFVDQRRVAVLGGKAPTLDAAAVDVERVTSSGAALGHMTKMVGALCNTVMLMARDRDTHDIRVAEVAMRYARDRDAQNRKLEAAASRQGKYAVQLRQLEMQGKDDAGFWETVKSFGAGVAPYLGSLLAPALGAKGGAATLTALDQFMANLSEEESEAVFAILGPRAAGMVLRARGEKAVALLYDAIISLGDVGAHKLLLVFEKDKQKFGTILQILKSERDRREAEEKAKNGSAGPAAPAASDASPEPEPAKEGAPS